MPNNNKINERRLERFNFNRKPDLSKPAADIGAAVNDSNKFYMTAYPILLESINTIREDGEDGVYAVAHMVYGWMPTTLKSIDMDALSDLGETPLCTIRGANCPNDILNYLKRPPINNSWVGTSKFLAFLKPSVFAIWDSNVAEHFMSSHALSERRRMVSYHDWIYRIAHSGDNDMKIVVDSMKKRYATVAKSKGIEARDVKPLRAIEWHLFNTLRGHWEAV